MKLIVRDFLKSLKEDGELDALLVDLLSEMGLSIQGTPQKGVAQNGVDLWAVGKIPPDEDNRIYLVSVKCGNLKRDNWDVGKQALRPSLNQIVDTFIKHYIPKPLMSLKKCVCVAVGGEVNPNVQQTVNDHLEYLRTSYDVDARILSGDEIAGLVCDHLLGATVLRGAGQRILFQALAMVQEPEASLRSFRQLLALLFEKEPKSFSEWTRQARAGILSLALLDSYCQEANNLEASCLGSEFFLLSLGEFVQHATSLSGFSAEMIDSVLRSAEKLSREIQKRYF